MRFFTQSCEIFNGSQSARKTEDHIHCDKTSELKPREGRAIDAKPQCLTNNDVCVSRFFAGKAPMEKIYNGQNGASMRYQHKHKESPTWPNIWKCLSDQNI